MDKIDSIEKVKKIEKKVLSNVQNLNGMFNVYFDGFAAYVLDDTS